MSLLSRPVPVARPGGGVTHHPESLFLELQHMSGLARSLNVSSLSHIYKFRKPSGEGRASPAPSSHTGPTTDSTDRSATSSWEHGLPRPGLAWPPWLAPSWAASVPAGHLEGGCIAGERAYPTPSHFSQDDSMIGKGPGGGHAAEMTWSGARTAEADEPEDAVVLSLCHVWSPPVGPSHSRCSGLSPTEKWEHWRSCGSPAAAPLNGHLGRKHARQDTTAHPQALAFPA